MLVIERKDSQRVIITTPDGRAIWISVYFDSCRQKIRLGFDAPLDFKIHRGELIPAAEGGDMERAAAERVAREARRRAREGGGDGREEEDGG